MLQKHLVMHQEALGEEGNVVGEGLGGNKYEGKRIQAGN